MDKYDLVFDIVTHPDKYSSERLEEILSDPEIREIYALLCKINYAAESQNELTSDEVEEKWEKFECIHFNHRPAFQWFSGRAASIAIFLLTSFVAVAIGLLVKVNVIDRKDGAVKTAHSAESRVVNPSAYRAPDTVMVRDDSVLLSDKTILFEDAPLEEIIGAVERIYHVKARFSNKKARELRLYYSLDPGKSLAETVDHLNTFKQINISLDGENLLID